jgi:hypothetical protein
VTTGALARAKRPLLGLRGASVQFLGARDLQLGGSGGLGGLPAQNLGFRAQFLSPGGQSVCFLTMSGGAEAIRSRTTCLCSAWRRTTTTTRATTITATMTTAMITATDIRTSFLAPL